MNSAQEFLAFAEYAALVLFCLSFFLTIYRVIVGPTLPDRIIGLDMLVIVAVGFIAVIGIRTSFTLFVDVAIALALVGFLATVAFARFRAQPRGLLGAAARTEQEAQGRREMIDSLVTIIVGLLLIFGGGFSLIASIGLNRLPDLYTRMHSASKGRNAWLWRGADRPGDPHGRRSRP